MAKIARLATQLARDLAGPPRMGIILGSGFNSENVLDDHLEPDWRQNEYSFAQLGIRLPAVHGHSNSIVVSKWFGIPVVVSRGRVHLYQAFDQPELLRLWVGTILTLMGSETRAIITNAVGSITHECPEGSLAIPSKLFSVLMQSVRYLKGSEGEFVSAGSVVAPNTQGCTHFKALSEHAAREAGLKLKSSVTYAAVVGPAYEDRGEIEFLQSQQVSTVGMSLVPELGLIAVENMDRKRIGEKTEDEDQSLEDWEKESPLKPLTVGPINFITNDETEPKPAGEKAEHGKVLNVGKRHEAQLGKFLTALIKGNW